MYPDLSYILHALIGTEPDNFTSIAKTFGIFLVITFLVAGFITNLEIKRKEQEGWLTFSIEKVTLGKAPSLQDLIYPVLMGFILGFKGVYIFFNQDEFIQDAAAVILSSKGHFLGGLLFAAINGGYQYWEIKKKALPKPKILEKKVWPHERIGDFVMIAAIGGVIGAKLFAIFETPENLKHFWEQLFSGAGMAIYGGLIVAFAACFWYWKRQGVNPIFIMDAVAPALMLGYGTGRMGCQFSGDGDWGIDNLNPVPDWWFLPDSFWAYDYPQNVLNRGNPIADCAYKYCSVLENPVYPTPVYEIFLSIIFFIILWSLRKRIVIPGLLFSIYLIMNGVERFFIEKIRVNDKLFEIEGVFSATQAEIISVSLFLLGIYGIYYCRKNKEKLLALKK